jgi:hypothetical protein
MIPCPLTIFSDLAHRDSQEVVREAEDPSRKVDYRFPIHYRTLTPGSTRRSSIAACC